MLEAQDLDVLKAVLCACGILLAKVKTLRTGDTYDTRDLNQVTLLGSAEGGKKSIGQPEQVSLPCCGISRKLQACHQNALVCL
jgi:hypothetical protein